MSQDVISGPPIREKMVVHSVFNTNEKMKKPFIYFLTILVLLFDDECLNAQSSPAFVFRNGDDGYACYRIPAIIKCPNGELLAFAEGRKRDCGDFGDIDLVMKRSTNHGRTWSQLQVIIDNGPIKAGNPAPVVDILDPANPNGTLFLLYNTATGSETNAREGLSVREVWYITSVDHGNTWSSPVNITTSVHRPLAPVHNPSYNFVEDWRTIALTPGHAFQFKTGNNKGRIFVAANHSVGAKKSSNDFDNYRAHCFYSDDHGKTWTIGADVPIAGGNESTAAELSTGSVLQNIRYQNETVKNRILAFSKSGGHTWDTAYVSTLLPDPVCQGSMISTIYQKKHILVFSNAASHTKRERLTIRVSFDDGQSWPVNFLVDPGPSSYSDIAEVKTGKLGLLYEKGSSGGIVYQLLSLKKICALPN